MLMLVSVEEAKGEGLEQHQLGHAGGDFGKGRGKMIKVGDSLRMLEGGREKIQLMEEGRSRLKHGEIFDHSQMQVKDYAPVLNEAESSPPLDSIN